MMTLPSSRRSQLTNRFIPFFIFVASITMLLANEPPTKTPVRVAMVGGMKLGGMWKELAARFTKETSWTVELVSLKPKSGLSEVLEASACDLFTMHDSAEATALVTTGFATDLKPWASNEHCILGPMTDPAGIRGMKDGAAALQKIAKAKSPFVEFSGHEVARKLWAAAGVQPEGDWVLKDESAAPEGVTEFAAKHDAYIIVGRIPDPNEKSSAAGLEVMVQGDPAMQRVFVVMIANVNHAPQCNHVGAKALSDWMTGDKGRAFLRDYTARHPDEPRLIVPQMQAPAKL